jgi:hypothetical protein
MARSLVISPASTVPMHEASNLRAKSSNLSLLSSLALREKGQELKKNKKHRLIHSFA